MKHSTIIKTLEYSIAAIFIMLIFTSYCNLPPSSYLIAIYCKTFNTDRYSPMLITSLLSLAYAVPVYFIKKKLSKKD